MNLHQRAQQLWSLLVLAGVNRQTLTYDLVGRLIGAPRVAVGGFLEPVQAYCMSRGFPPLTALVVSADTGLPGSGFIAAEDVPAAQERVYEFDWLGQQAPAEQIFQELL